MASIVVASSITRRLPLRSTLKSRVFPFSKLSTSYCSTPFSFSLTMFLISPPFRLACMVFCTAAEGVSEPALGTDCGRGFLHRGSVDPAGAAAAHPAVLHRVVDAQGADRGYRGCRKRAVDASDRQESYRCRRRNSEWQALSDP